MNSFRGAFGNLKTFLALDRDKNNYWISVTKPDLEVVMNVTKRQNEKIEAQKQFIRSEIRIWEARAARLDRSDTRDTIQHFIDNLEIMLEILEEK